jgi:hypothetical protein
MTRQQKALFCSGMILLVLGMIELASFLLFHYRADAFSFFDPRAYVLASLEIQKFRPAYDPDLGWQEHYATPFGERPREVDYPQSLLATFGDSYTHCDQVRDNETWQTYLARELQQDVFNFGSGGYGTDQAYLRFKRDYPRVRTQLVALGLISENINRVVCVYRKFYYPKTGVPLTKPRFVLQAGRLRELRNPIRSAADLVRLKNAQFLADLGRDDQWYNPNELPERSFPYTRIWLNRSFWREMSYGKLDHQISDMDPRPWANLWEQPEARKLLFTILDQFVADARSFGATPIIIILAKKEEVRYRFTTQRNPQPIRILSSYLRQQGYYFFDGAAALASEAHSLRDISRFYSGHLNARGNRLVAKHLFAYLQAHRLTGEAGTGTESRTSIRRSTSTF